MATKTTVTKTSAKKVAPEAAAPKRAFPAKKPSTAPKTPPMTREEKADLVLHDAPEGLKPFVVRVTFRTLKDGYVSAENMKVERVKGRWDNPEAKSWDMFTYDSTTAAAIIGRLCAATAATNPLRRLPPLKGYRAHLRVGATKDGQIRVSVAAVESTKRIKGVTKWGFLAKAEDGTVPVAMKLIRRAARHLRGAFTVVQEPPAPLKRARSAALDE